MPVLLVLLIALPIAEVWLLVQVGALIGVWWTILILVAEAALGAWLMRREGRRAWAGLNAAFTSGKMPTGELADAALVLVGGVALMLPGFITDVFGFVFLLPFTRPYARRVLGFIVARRVNQLGVDVLVARADTGNIVPGEVVDAADPGPTRRPGDDDIVIRGEIEDGPERTP